MIGVQREQDFRDDIEVVSSDGVSFQFNKAHLVALCPALVTTDNYRKLQRRDIKTCS